MEACVCATASLHLCRDDRENLIVRINALATVVASVAAAVAGTDAAAAAAATVIMVSNGDRNENAKPKCKTQ